MRYVNLTFGAGLWRWVPRWVKMVLAAFALFFLLLLGFCAFMSWRWQQAMEAGRKTPLYKAALSRVQASPKVMAAMGRPVRAGEVEKVLAEDRRSADFIVFRLEGSKANARVYATGGDKTHPERLTELRVWVWGEPSKNLYLVPPDE